MTMKNYSLKTKQNSGVTSRRRFALLLVLLVCVTALLALFLRGVVGTVFGGALGTFYRVEEYFRHSTAILPTYIRSRSELEQELSTLRASCSLEDSEDATLARLTYENDELRALLGDAGEERVLAGVIARPPFAPYDLLVVDKGSADGITEGALAYVGNNHVLGMVTRVFPQMSYITLLTSPGTETTVYLYGSHIFAYAYGEGGGVLRISIPQGIEIHEGDPVVLPSSRSGEVGTIDYLVSSPTEPEQSAYVTLPQSLQSVRTIALTRTPMSPTNFMELETNVSMVTERLKIPVPPWALLGTEPTSTQATST